ncbi:hypothetical protein EBZ35_09110 [bacterium]|nr:hypothetical protein [bacterium]
MSTHSRNILFIGTLLALLTWGHMTTAQDSQPFLNPPPPSSPAGSSLATEVAALKLEIIKLKNQPKTVGMDRSDRDRMDRMQQDLLQTKAELQRVRREMDDLNSELKRFKNLFFKHF